MKLWLTAAAALLAAQDQTFDLVGRLVPETQASLTLHGATTPFSASALTDARGRFQFRKLAAGAYTLSAFVPGQGEARRTIEIGPSLADAKGRIELTIEMQFTPERREGLVSARELSIPDRARREYENAQRRLGRRDIPGAIEHLERAVKIAPQFSEAWNNLGTIAYQTQQYEKAERHFREALKQDRNAYAPLVNLGGVLLNLRRFDEALNYNRHAVLTRPHDALANSQLGLSYFALGNLDQGRKYLETAKRLDPAHFSHPQMTLAEIHLQQKNPRAAADELEDFLKHHPDAPQAAQMREAIKKLRQ